MPDEKAVPIFPEQKVEKKPELHAKAPQSDWHWGLAKIQRRIIDHLIAIERKMGASPADLTNIHRMRSDLDTLVGEIEPDAEPEASKQTPDSYKPAQSVKTAAPIPTPSPPRPPVPPNPTNQPTGV